MNARSLWASGVSRVLAVNSKQWLRLKGVHAFASFLTRFNPMGVGITVTIISPTPGGQETITTEAGEAITTEDAFTIKTETT